MPTQINRYKEAAEDKEESRTKKQLRYTFEIFLGVSFVIKNDNGARKGGGSRTCQSVIGLSKTVFRQRGTQRRSSG